MVGEKISSKFCRWVVQMCRILGCIYRKRQYAGHDPVSAGHGPMCRQDSDTVCPNSDVRSERMDTRACWLGTSPCRRADYEVCLFSKELIYIVWFLTG
ncbi:hypothetical protein Hanom_Chr06g00520691 [Helianthus anomalus]